MCLATSICKRVCQFVCVCDMHFVFARGDAKRKQLESEREEERESLLICLSVYTLLLEIHRYKMSLPMMSAHTDIYCGIT